METPILQPLLSSNDLMQGLKQIKSKFMRFTELKEKVVELSAEDRFKLSAFLADLEQERDGIP